MVAAAVSLCVRKFAKKPEANVVKIAETTKHTTTGDYNQRGGVKVRKDRIKILIRGGVKV